MAYRYLLSILIGIVLVGCKEPTENLIREGIRLKDNGDNASAIAKFQEVIERNGKLQIAYYDQALCYANLKEYSKAIGDLDRILSMQGGIKGFEIIMNPDRPFATDEDKAYVPQMTVLFERALIEYSTDSLKSSFYDFKTCLENNYQIKDCYLWMGTIYIRCGNKSKGCELYQKANPFGNNADAIRLVKDNCN